MEKINSLDTSLRIAMVGCLHGCLKDVYDAIEIDEIKTGKKVDLLLCCGDFESVRNKDDLRYKSCPEKYKHLGQFRFYYNSTTPAPILTIFIGGNHEASNVLDLNYYGGWITDNIFYLGRAGVIKYKGIRIAGLSGIYKNFDYFKGHFETNLLKDIKSIYHVREFEIAKMSHLTGEIDFFMTHDWPTGSVNKTDFNRILKTKRRWKDELYSGTLGSPASSFLLKHLKPKYFLSGHMHYAYFNDIYHNEAEITKFIALDKAGTKQNRYFLHILDYSITNNSEEITTDDNIYFDEEWLAITKAFNPHIPLTSTYINLSNFVSNTNEYINSIKDAYFYTWKNKNNFYIPSEDFNKSITTYTNEFYSLYGGRMPWLFLYGNKQREYITQLIGIEDFHKYKTKEFLHKKQINTDKKLEENSTQTQNQEQKQVNQEEIELDLEF